MSSLKRICFKRIEDVHLPQIFDYLKAYKLEVGFLINFGSKSMTFKRAVLSNPCLHEMRSGKREIQNLRYPLLIPN